MKYLAILGRNKALSLAELMSLYDNVVNLNGACASFESASEVNIDRLGGCMKLARPIEEPVIQWLMKLPEGGKIVLGISDYDKGATGRKVGAEALKLKKILTRHGRSVRVVLGNEAVLSTATVLHNGLGLKGALSSGRSSAAEKALSSEGVLGSSRKVELIKFNGKWYANCGVQNIDAYARRDQARPARDARVGMLPPKLAQILVNLCGPLPTGARVLDPFCGTGVVLQEALLMGYQVYGTDVDERMVRYTQKNLEWLSNGNKQFSTSVGDATSFTWEQPIDAVACETYLGPPLKEVPTEVELKEIKQEINSLLYHTLQNLSIQLKPGAPVVMATPAWLRPNNEYLGLNLLDEIESLGYNVKKFTAPVGRLLYHRNGQIVAREIIVLRKK